MGFQGFDFRSNSFRVTVNIQDITIISDGARKPGSREGVPPFFLVGDHLHFAAFNMLSLQ
jgi:hypothetical protein